MSNIYTCAFCGQRGFGYTLQITATFFGQSVESDTQDVSLCLICREEKMKQALALFKPEVEDAA